MRGEDRSGIGFWEAVSIGVGGMVGGGIFAVLGLAVELAGGGTAVAFTLAGLIALLTAYSYARLSVTFPSQGGTVAFINTAFGSGLFTGSLNVLLWLSYIVMLSLYAYAFGSYGATLFAGGDGFWKHALISASVSVVALLNLARAGLIGEAEDWIVALKVIILLIFIAVGLAGITPARLAPDTWSPPLQLLAGGMVIFVAYEGFELIANTAQDVRNPARVLPRAFFAAVGFVVVLYVLVALVTVGNLPLAQVAAARDYALAQAARPFLGHAGFVLIVAAALLSTLSAINATLYGAARLSYIIAKDGELPEVLEHKIWNRPIGGLLVTVVCTLLTANLLDLSSISTTGSAGFLLIFAAVNLANVRLAKRTASRGWISMTAAAACVLALAVLLWQTALRSPERLWVVGVLVGGAFAVEVLYRLASGRQINVVRSPSGR